MLQKVLGFILIIGLMMEQEQYKFVYDTLEENIQCGFSWFPVSELSMRLKQKSVRDSTTKLNEYQKEFTVSPPLFIISFSLFI